MTIDENFKSRFNDDPTWQMLNRKYHEQLDIARVRARLAGDPGWNNKHVLPRNADIVAARIALTNYEQKQFDLMLEAAKADGTIIDRTNGWKLQLKRVFHTEHHIKPDLLT